MNGGRGSPWHILGIPPTSDAREIRSAYVRALKAIDVDADPAAFIALRGALEAAQAVAAQAEFGGADEQDRPGQDDPATAPRAEVDSPQRALVQLLRESYAPCAPSPEQSLAMLELWSEIVSDPRLEHVEHFADTERWAAELIAATVPFSDPLVVPAVLRFGWTSRAGTIGLDPAPRFLVARAGPLSLASELRAPDHPLHAAWSELTRPPDPDGGLRRGQVSAVEIDKLVSMVLRTQPELYTSFEPGRLALWQIRPSAYFQAATDAPKVGRAYGYYWLFAFGAMVILKIIAAISMASGR